MDRTLVGILLICFIGSSIPVFLFLGERAPTPISVLKVEYPTIFGPEQPRRFALNILAREDALYRQDYCGCLFGLTMQREQQQKLADELFVPISGQIQPESIEARIEMYEERWELEERGLPHRIVKQRFLNWRLSMGLLRIRKEVVPAHFLPYSTLKGEYTRGKTEYATGELHHMNRDEVKFITLETYNHLSGTDYSTVTELIFAPPRFEKEVILRSELGMDPYDLSAILVVEDIPSNKIEILCQSTVYSDVKEVLIAPVYN